MSSFWETHKCDPENLAKLGPWVDGIVGTDGEYQDLYEAVNTGGWSRIILATGATMSADVTISATSGFLWAPRHWIHIINSNSRKLTLTGDYWYLAGFRINTPNGTGITINADWVAIERVSVAGATASGHGIHLIGGDDHRIGPDVYLYNNAGDGLRIDSGINQCKVIDNKFANNGGWGINDLSNTIIEASNYYTGNTSGGLNTTSTSVNGKSDGGA